MADYYVNLKLTGSGGDGSSGNPWRQDDLSSYSLPRPFETDTVYITGYADMTGKSSIKIEDAGFVLPWHPMEPYGSSGDIYLLFDLADDTKTVKNWITDSNYIDGPVNLESCLFLRSSDIYFGYMNTNNPTSIQDLKGCTFAPGDGNAMVYNEYEYDTPIEINFDDCLFVDSVFDNGGSIFGSGNPITLNFNNCTFIGKTQAEVFQFFPSDTYVTINLTNCRFNRSLATPFPTSVSEFFGYTAKYKSLFEQYDPGDDTLTGDPIGGDYSSSAKGLWGGERRGVGAFWFVNTYYADLETASSSGTGDGLSIGNQWGTTDLLSFLQQNVIDERRIREGDIFMLDGTYQVPNGSPFEFNQQITYQNNDWTNNHLYDPHSTEYRNTIFRPQTDDDPVIFDCSLETVNIPILFGDGNIFERFVIYENWHPFDGDTASTILKSCYFMNEVYDFNWDGAGSPDLYYYGCTFVGNAISLDAAGTKILEFTSCLFSGLDGGDLVVTGGGPGDYIDFFDSVFLATQVEVEAGYTGSGLNFDDCIFGAQLKQDLPKDIPSVLKDDMNFFIYDLLGNLNGLGNWGYSYWTEFDFGLYNQGRFGIGAFYFGSPISSNVYYADSDAVTPGTGLEVDPWTYDQVRNYLFNGTPVAVSGDIVKAKGIFEIGSTSSSSFYLNGIENKTINIEAWDKEANGPIIFIPEDGTSIAQIFGTINCSDLVLNISDFVFLGDRNRTINARLINLGGDNDICNVRNMLFVSACNSSPLFSGDITSQLNIYGSTISIDAAATVGLIFEPEPIGEVNIIDSIFNFHGTKDPDDWIDVNFNYVETNMTSVDIDGTGMAFNNMEYNSSAVALIPTSIAFDAFNISDFIFGKYAITNPGQGSSAWASGGYNDGLKGLTRQGIGAWWFFEIVPRIFYSNANGTAGDGSESSPFNYEQLRNYFNPDIGTACGVIPQMGDTIRIKGIANGIFSGEIFNVKINVSGSITLEAWEIATNGIWLIETENFDNSIELISIESGYGIDNLILRDFALLDNRPSSTDSINLHGSTAPVRDSEYELFNFMVYSDKNVSFVPPANSTAKAYGFTIRGNEVYIPETSGGDIEMVDGVIQALDRIYYS